MTTTHLEARATSYRIAKSDWFLYALALSVTACLPLALTVGGWVPEGVNWLRVALGAGVLGLWQARLSQRAGVSWLSGSLVGVAVGLLVVGHMLPPAQMVRGDLARVWDWLWQLVVERHRDPNLPLSFAATHFVTQAQDLFERLELWYTVVRVGGVSTDTRALLLSVWLGAWLLSWNATFQLARYRRTLSALVPLGLVVLACVGYTGLGIEYARLYLGLALVIFMWANAGRMQMLWQQRGVRVSLDLRRRVFLTGLPLASAVLVLALLIPSSGDERAVQFFWDRMGGRLRDFYTQLDRAFAGRNPVRRPSLNTVIRSVLQPAVALASSDLNEHDIRGGAATSNEVVFSVQTSDAQPGRIPPTHYWRERTYDQYTGTGWATSDTEIASYAANHVWKEVAYPATALAQTFMLQGAASPSLAVNEPVSMGGDYAVRMRSDGDLAALFTKALTYSVVSMVPDATLPELRAAELDYPAWVKDRFLALPSVPDRVQRTAQQIVRRARATTRYEKAVAIQDYLRTFVYDTEIKPPPDGVDVVDYYLRIRRGYCDYAATAMVVMLRSEGVAARYASGYGPGQYDITRGVWVVRGSNAHAWPEVYFPGYGWIEFEPTAAQGLLTRNTVRATPTPTPTAMPTEEPLPTPSEGAPVPAPSPDLSSRRGGLLGGGLVPLAAIGGGILCVLGCAVVLAGQRPGRAPRDPRQAVGWVYAQLQRRAQRLGIRPQTGHTPREYLAELATHLGRRVGAAEEVTQDVSLIGQLYERVRYSAQDLTLTDGLHARQAWERLRQRMGN